MNEYMKSAIEEARKAYELGEIPVGAVVVKEGEIIGRGHNLTETLKDPTAHAEMLAIREAAKTLGGWRLLDCDIYVTLEPCSMCAGALVWSRMRAIYYGADDPKGGGCGSVFDIVRSEDLNHKLEVHSGLEAEECAKLMKDFFRELRIR